MLESLKSVGYAGLLRPVGQTLDNLRIESFTVVSDADGFIVRDKTRNRAQLTPREKAFLSELSAAHSAVRAKQDALRLASGVIEWHLTAADIERLERAGRERRREGEQTADSHSVSQILRSIGEIVDQKCGRLISVSKIENLITVEYLSTSGRLVSENYTMPMIYNLWVRMYKKRAVDHSQVA
ncbi:MAG: hypothetical protein FJ143_10710 [Deltaproteobacteria bacterium]|nr:hypothetical protein [Deltaproteobacteria bacterium]